MNYCGIDAHHKSSTVCILDEKGNELMLAKTTSNAQGLNKKLNSYDNEMPIILEACSASRPVFKNLQTLGFANTIYVHPGATSKMRARGKKTDFADAHALAELARLGLSHAWKVHVPGEWAQSMRDLLYEREFVIKHRVAGTNRVKALFRRAGKSSPSLKGNRGWNQVVELLPAYSEELEFLKEMRGQYVKREDELTRVIKSEVAKHAGFKLVNSVPCVGHLTSAVLLSCIDDISRFRSAKALASYLGLVPSVYQTGSTERTGGITKRGSSLARKFLAQAAHHARYSSSPFNPVYRDLVQNKGSARAIIAVARKIVHSVYAVLKYNEPFDSVKMGLLKVDKEVKFTRVYAKAHKIIRS